MAVFELGQHVGTYSEQLIVAHAVVDARFIDCVYRVPIDVFVIEIAIVFVTNFPKHFEVAFSVICEIFIVVDVARLQRHCTDKCEYVV